MTKAFSYITGEMEECTQNKGFTFSSPNIAPIPGIPDIDLYAMFAQTQVLGKIVPCFTVDNTVHDECPIEYIMEGAMDEGRELQFFQTQMRNKKIREESRQNNLSKQVQKTQAANNTKKLMETVNMSDLCDDTDEETLMNLSTNMEFLKAVFGI